MAKSTNKPQKKLPFVSVCTPTFNRRPFIPMIVQCFLNQTYPRERMEWIIIDDGTDKIGDILKTYNIPQIKYIELPNKITLGEKRNLLHKHSTGSFIVYMDDDDYYPPERVSHAIESLLANPSAMVAGSSEMYVYFKHINKMYQSGPFGPNHATAATFAFRTELLKDTQYDNHASMAEEKVFLKNYTVPMVQLDPMKSILVFSHDQNSFDKRKLLETGQNPTFKESPKTIPMFIRNKNEKPILDFFLKDIDMKLKEYEPGEAKYKPDVVKQLKEMEEERAKQLQEMIKSGQLPPQKIMLQRPGEAPTELSVEDVVKILQTQQDHIKNLLETIKSQEAKIQELNAQLQKSDVSEGELFFTPKSTEPFILNYTPQSLPIRAKGKSDPEVFVSLN
uniref:Glycosyltransferase 2-like domain-containing protein n=1 Tax=viral metagenome TaxID=1070528 RepID=A0A6C0HIR9_9ZZZZ